MRHYKLDERVRQVASEVYKIFESMFGVPDKITFSQVCILTYYHKPSFSSFVDDSIINQVCKVPSHFLALQARG